jgi:hypothetical protein
MKRTPLFLFWFVKPCRARFVPPESSTDESNFVDQNCPGLAL